MANQANLLFKISAESEAEAALKELKADLQALDTQIKAFSRSVGLLPSETRQLVAQFSALDTEAKQVAFAMEKFGGEALDLLPTLQTLARQSRVVEQNFELINRAARTAETGVKSFRQLAAEADAQMRLVQRQSQDTAEGVNKVGKAFSNLSSEVASAIPHASQITSILSAIGAKGGVAAAIAATTAAIGGAVVATGNYARQLERGAAATGFTITELNALKFALDQIGGSFNDVLDMVNQFATALQEARTDNVELAIIFKKLGVDINNAGLTMGQAFDQALKGLAGLSDEFEKARIRGKLWGEEGGRQIPQLLRWKEGMAGLKDEIIAVGNAFDEEAIRGAAEFDKALDRLIAKFKAGFHKANLELIENLKAIRDFPTGVIRELEKAFGVGAFSPERMAKSAEEFAKFNRELERLRKEGAAAPPPPIEDAAQKAAREKREKEAKEAAKKAADERKKLEAQIAEDTLRLRQEQAKASLAVAEIEFEAEKALLDASLKDKLISEDRYVERSIDNEQRLFEARQKAAAAARDVSLEKQKTQMGRLAVETEHEAEQAKILAEHQARLFEIYTASPRRLQEMSDRLKEQTKELERNQESLNKYIENWKKLADEQFIRNMKDLQVAVQGTFLDPSRTQAVTIAVKAQAESVGFLTRTWQELTRSIKEAAKAIEEDWVKQGGIVREEGSKQVEVLGSLALFFKEVGQKSLKQFAAGMGEIVEQYVVLGQTGPAVMRKMLASVLASIAAEAAVRAVYMTAYGLAMLALFQFQAAAQAFASAAIFAGIAGATAIAGRAVAPQESTVGAQGQFGGPPAPVTINQGGGAAIGRTPEDLYVDLTDAIRGLKSMPPGDVLVVAAKDRPDAIAMGFAESARRSDSNISDGLKDAGVK